MWTLTKFAVKKHYFTNLQILTKMLKTLNDLAVMTNFKYTVLCLLKISFYSKTARKLYDIVYIVDTTNYLQLNKAEIIKYILMHHNKHFQAEPI